MIILYLTPFMLGSAYFAAIGIQDGDWKLPFGIFFAIATVFVGVVLVLAKPKHFPGKSIDADLIPINDEFGDKLAG